MKDFGGRQLPFANPDQAFVNPAEKKVPCKRKVFCCNAAASPVIHAVNNQNSRSIFQVIDEAAMC